MITEYICFCAKLSRQKSVFHTVMWFLLGSIQMTGEMPGGSAAQEPVCNMLWLPPSPQSQNKFLGSFQEGVATVVPAVQTQLKWLHLFYFGNLCISIILLPALFFPLSSQKKSKRNLVGHKSIKVNLRLTWSKRSRSSLTSFMYLLQFLAESFQPRSVTPQIILALPLAFSTGNTEFCFVRLVHHISGT